AELVERADLASRQPQAHEPLELGHEDPPLLKVRVLPALGLDVRVRDLVPLELAGPGEIALCHGLRAFALLLLRVGQFAFFMDLVAPTPGAELAQFELLGRRALVLGGVVVVPLALAAREANQFSHGSPRSGGPPGPRACPDGRRS